MEFKDNPFTDFPWVRLYELYDEKSRHFKHEVPKVRQLGFNASTDRDLYYELVKLVESELKSDRGLRRTTFLGVLLWKHYSHHISKQRIYDFIENHGYPGVSALGRLTEILSRPPSDYPRWFDAMAKDFSSLSTDSNVEFLGNGKEAALATRSTFLHFAFPHEAPIIDVNVLKAVDARNEEEREGVNYSTLVKSGVYEQLRYAFPTWKIVSGVRDYVRSVGHLPEGNTRLLDMALWVRRGD